MIKLNRRESHPPLVRALTLLAVIAFGVILYTFKVGNNPPGFYIDESSIAYNAYLISETGRDEFGTPWPIFFRAFGDYKNPIYIYLLAAIFTVTGPSILVARLLSAILGVLAAIIAGLIAERLSKRREVGLIITVMALLTPWLFELSRVVLEVALYPLAVALFLLVLYRAAQKSAWNALDTSGLAATLALLTYCYSIGRLFAPLLAFGLLFFVKRARVVSVLRVWTLYALLLMPLIISYWRHPETLINRFKLITYWGPQSTYGEIVWEFIKHYLGNFNPWAMLVRGDPNPDQIASIDGVGLILTGTFVLAAFGIFLVLRHERREGWWRFVLYGFAVSAVPASLTTDYFHMLRLAAMPVFLWVLCVPALTWLVEPGGRRARRVALVAIVVATLLQGILFQWQYHRYGHSPRRVHLFDANYFPKIFSTALGMQQRPVYLADAPPIPGYIQALWYATLRGISTSEFKQLAHDIVAPEGALVITTEDIRPRCRVLAEEEPYTVCLMQGAPRQPAPLPNDGFRAEIIPRAILMRARVKEKIDLYVVVRNTSNATWLARERGSAPFQISLGNHWLDSAGREAVHDDGRASVPRDVRPGEEVEVKLVVNAPKHPGVYVLELDMLQEGVSWFAHRGSPTVRLPVTVERSWLD